MENERDHSKFIIQRFDNYISGANTKGSFLLAFNTFICSIIISNYKSLKELITEERGLCYLNISLVLLFILTIITSVFILNAVYPFLKSGNSRKEKYHSNIFFRSVAEYENDSKYLESFKNQTDALVNEDMAHQSYWLAKGLKSKYALLSWGMRFVYAELFIMLIILLIILIY
jgi:hypothetical protein